MIMFSALCIASIVFLLSFFVALCREGKRPHYIVQAQHQREIDVPKLATLRTVVLQHGRYEWK
jgi:hypothetical protein